MRRRRPVVQYAPLTSLLDVMFILVFASLIYSAGLEAREKERAAGSAPTMVAPAPAPMPPGQVDPEELRKVAVAEILAGLEGRRPVVARVGTDGRLRQVERRDDGRPVVTTADLPLVEAHPNPDIGMVYLGERGADLRLCNLVRLQLGAADLSAHLVIVALDASLDDMSEALRNGLERDVERCVAEQRGVAVLLDPRAAAAVERRPEPEAVP